MDRTGSNGKRLVWVALEFVFLCLLLAAVPFVVYLDTNVIGQEMSEESLTELLHNTGAFIAMLCFYRGARTHPDKRAFLVMGGTLFAMISIREFDFLFDHIVHGFWLYPALTVLAIGSLIALRNRGTFVSPMLHYLTGREATFVYLGFALLIIFTRLFGTGDLWEGVMKDSYNPGVKAAVQEGLELLSYMLIAYGSVASLRTGFVGAGDTTP